MILQSFTWNENNENSIKSLYCRGMENKTLESLPISLGNKMVLSTNTYMNSFSIEKWQKYCMLDSLSLHLFVSGNIKVSVVNTHLNATDVMQEEEIFSAVVTSQEMTELKIPLDRRKGVIYYTIEALADSCIFYDAYYEEETAPMHNINLAINICTYKREKDLLHNVTILKENILENKKSPLYKKVKCYIVDNGQTLHEVVKATDDIFLFMNRNVGGAGGFTRGLMEIEKDAEELGLTHVIFMDDDIELNCEAVNRTFALLSYLSDEYQDSFIAGALLDINEKWMQQESGALWNQGNCNYVHQGLDMRIFDNVVFSEREAKRDYAAWWYCCMNLQTIDKKNNLPIPIFVHMDDVEYSLRNASNIITMNGIAVWHPTSAHRRIATNEYYNCRNTLIVNVLYYEDISYSALKINVVKSILAAFLRMRYAVMDLLVQAIEDFCKGPEWLLSIDSVAYHQLLMKRGDKLTDVSEYLSKGDIKAFYMNVYPIKLLHIKKAILYDEIDQKGIIVKRDWKEVFHFLLCVMKVCRSLDKHYSAVQEKYRLRRTELQSEESWRKILKL